MPPIVLSFIYIVHVLVTPGSNQERKTFLIKYIFIQLFDLHNVIVLLCTLLIVWYVISEETITLPTWKKNHLFQNSSAPTRRTNLWIGCSSSDLDVGMKSLTRRTNPSSEGKTSAIQASGHWLRSSFSSFRRTTSLNKKFSLTPFHCQIYAF